MVSLDSATTAGIRSEPLRGMHPVAPSSKVGIAKQISDRSMFVFDGSPTPRSPKPSATRLQLFTTSSIRNGFSGSMDLTDFRIPTSRSMLSGGLFATDLCSRDQRRALTSTLTETARVLPNVLPLVGVFSTRTGTIASALEVLLVTMISLCGSLTALVVVLVVIGVRGWVESIS